MRNLLQDLRFGVRLLGKNPGFTAVAVLTLALGISAMTVVFSLVNAVLLQPLPYPEPDRLAMIRVSLGKDEFLPSISGFELLSFRQRSQLFDAFEGIWPQSVSLTGIEEPERLRSGLITLGFLKLLGADPVVGRHFLAEECTPTGPPVAILSHGLWQRRFGGDRKFVGQNITIGDRRFTVVGVMPKDFRAILSARTNKSSDLDIWLPIKFDFRTQFQHQHWLRVIARMKPGVTVEQAQAEMDAFAKRLPRESSAYGSTKIAFQVKRLQSDLVENAEPALLTIFAAVGFVLLIVCVNVANLLLARALAREKEMAVRVALGASGGRILRQIVTESFILAAIGGTVGVLLAKWSLPVVLRFIPDTLPRVEEASLDGTVLLFGLAAAGLTGLVASIVPAYRTSRTDVNTTLKETAQNVAGSRAHRLRQGLVVAEIALSLVLLVGAGLMMRSFVRLQKVHPGFDSDQVLTFSISPGRRYYDPRQAAILFRQIEERIESLPGIAAVGSISQLPLSGNLMTGKYATDEQTEGAEDNLMADYRVITPGYFKAMGIGLLNGRLYTWQDVDGSSNTVVVDDNLAKRAWPNENPIGKRILVDTSTEKKWMEVMGVVEHVRNEDLTKEGRDQIYLTHRDRSFLFMSVVLRGSGDSGSMAGPLRQAVQEVNKDMPIYDLRTMDQYLSDATAGTRFTLFLMAVFAAIAVLLAAVGIYGVIAYWVNQRTQEISIRMAVGATPANIFKLILGRGIILAVAGMVIGLLAALALTRFLSGQLFGVSPTDPTTFAAIVLLLTTVSLLACYIPARRATKVDPVAALRYE